MDYAKDGRRLDKKVPVPLYYQLKQIIINDIQQGKLLIGEALPPELDLCDIFEVSRVTVRQAVMELVSEGYLYRRKGKGTFVSKPKIEAKFFTKLQSFNDEIVQKGMIPSTRVLEIRVLEPVPKINKRLNTDSAGKLIFLKRLRFADNDPVVYLETYLPYDSYSELVDEDFTHKSLYDILDHKYQTRVVHVTRQIEAVNCRPDEAELLQIDPFDAICLVHTTGYAQSGEVVEYSIARYRGDLNQFTVELYKE